MEKASYRHYFIVIVLMTLTGIALLFSSSVQIIDESGVVGCLPEAVGNFTGRDLLFCQNEQCPNNLVGIAVEDTNICPVCGSRLDTISLGEKGILPPDTVVLKKQYTAPGEIPLSVSIVLSGAEQRSIHRPEYCLPATGHIIERNRAISVPLSSHRSLKVMVLDSRKQGKTLSTYAYWFVGMDRETPYHLQRLFWMAADRIIRNRTCHWAYIAVATDRREGSNEHIKRLQSFIAKLYPLIIKRSEGIAE